MRTLVLFSNLTSNPSHTNTYVTVVLEVDPFRSEGTAWLESARLMLSATAKNNTFDAFLVDGAAIEYDAVRVAYASFPLMVAVTTSVVLIFLAGAFRSVGATFRSVLSIGVTLSFVYGLTVLVYRYGIFNWTGVRGLSSSGIGGTAAAGESEGGDEISFLPPLMAFTVIVGLGLDYDVFLTTRILEYRQQTTSTTTMIGEDGGGDYRINHTDSILLGFEQTGGIITYAGVIMFVAFGGLLWSECTVLNQFAFFLVSAVLLDTFVVRTVLVPIVLELCGEKWGWWPRTFED